MYREGIWFSRPLSKANDTEKDNVEASNDEGEGWSQGQGWEWWHEGVDQVEDVWKLDSSNEQGTNDSDPEII